MRPNYRPNHRYPQCRDVHGDWCPGCSKYLMEDDRPERHHLIPKAKLRDPEVAAVLGKSAYLLRRKIAFCASCHRETQPAADTLGIELIKICRDGLSDKFAFALDQTGMFEISAAFHARHLGSEVFDASKTNNYLFAAGGAAHVSHDLLDKIWLSACKERNVNLALTLAGPAINSGHFVLARKILDEIELETGVKSSGDLGAITLRRRAMLNLDPKAAGIALSESIGGSVWSVMTARVLCAQSSTINDTLTLEAAHEHLHGILSMEPDNIGYLASRFNVIRNADLLDVSVFHYASTLCAVGNFYLIRNDRHKALEVFYQVQFLRAIFGLRLLPTRRVWKNENEISIIDPYEPIQFCIDSLRLEPEACQRLRAYSLGEDTTDFTYGYMTAVMRNFRQREMEKMRVKPAYGVDTKASHTA